MAERRTSTGANRLEPNHTDGPSLPTGDDYHNDYRDQVDRKTVVEREQEEHGGIKWGSAFFGWLTATGMAVLLTALAAAAGTAVGVATDTKVGQAADTATEQVDTVGLVGGIILLVIMFVAYYCGGYVAGRMARFNGLKQGLGVWLWAIIVAVVVAIVGLVAGAEYNVLQKLTPSPASRSAKEPSPPAASSRWPRLSPPPWVGRCSAAWPACGSTARSTRPASAPNPAKQDRRRRWRQRHPRWRPGGLVG